MQDFTNRFILESMKLPIVESLSELSYTTGLSSRILYLLAKNNDKFYKSFEIDKKDGSKRQIFAPTQKMKLVQRWVLENVLYYIPISGQAMAFKKDLKCGIKVNAQIHKDSLYLLEIDLKDFFTSIKRERVFYIFRNLGYNKFISNWFADICTYNGYVPQGAITSPHISNIVCKNLDKRILGLCSKREVIYTRYADDMTFSCDNKETLKKMYKCIKSIVEDEGFIINQRKTRFLSPGSCKRVTGITINDDRVKASKELKRRVRAMIHRSIATGDYSKNKNILGYVSFINSIEEGYTIKIKKYITKLIQSHFIYEDNIVNQYNLNRLYSDLEEVISAEVIMDEWDDDYDEEICNMMIENAEQNNEFRKKHGYKCLYPELENID